MNQQDEDETQVFRRAMQGVRRLQPRPTPPTARLRTPRAHMARAERAAVLEESLEAPGPLIQAQPEEELLFRRPAVSDAIMRRLRRGHYRVEAELDLHGLTAADGAAQLREFLQYARRRELRCVRVIHGKGLRSGQRGPVLKSTVNTLLRRTALVLAFTSARPAAGGTGATLVLLGAPR